MSATATAAAGVVTAYAEAKSRGDVDGALHHCSDDVVMETIPFQTVVVGRDANRLAFGAFLGIFPDYSVELQGTTGTGGLLTGWGKIRATMRGRIGLLAATDRRFELPFACVWHVMDGALAHERFFFDLHQMCEQLGLDTAATIAEIRRFAP